MDQSRAVKAYFLISMSIRDYRYEVICILDSILKHNQTDNVEKKCTWMQPTYSKAAADAYA